MASRRYKSSPGVVLCTMIFSKHARCTDDTPATPKFHLRTFSFISTLPHLEFLKLLPRNNLAMQRKLTDVYIAVRSAVWIRDDAQTVEPNLSHAATISTHTHARTSACTLRYNNAQLQTLCFGFVVHVCGAPINNQMLTA